MWHWWDCTVQHFFLFFFFFFLGWGWGVGGGGCYAGVECHYVFFSDVSLITCFLLTTSAWFRCWTRIVLWYVIPLISLFSNQYKYIIHWFVQHNILTWTCSSTVCTHVVNPLRAKFFRGNINIYLHFVSFLHITTTQVVEILPQIRQEPTYSTWSISWLLMSWRRKEPGHQQPWYWPS